LYFTHFLGQYHPVRLQIVQHTEEYLYSSARNYAGLSNFLKVDVLVLPAKIIR